MADMDTVDFITTQEGDDLVLSFAILDPSDARQIRSLTLQRTPQYEVFMPPGERGVHVSYELESQGYLRSLEFSDRAKVVRLATARMRRELDLSNVPPGSLETMCRLLRVLSAGGGFELRITC